LNSTRYRKDKYTTNFLPDNMPVAFTDDDGERFGAYLSRTIEGDDDSSVEEENISDIGSVGTASAYEGDVKEAPVWMFFGNLECRAIFELAQDKNKFHRVCGRHMGTCRRSGHGVTGKAEVGYYKTVAARKYLDGVESTYLTKEVYEAREKERKAKGTEEIEEAIAFIQGGSPANSEEKAYAEALGYTGEKKTKMDGKQIIFGKDEASKFTPTKTESGGAFGDNKLLASPTMMGIASVGKTEAGMLGLMDKLAGAVVETTERLKNLEEQQATSKGISETSQTSDQLATMTALMAKMMTRMETLEETKAHKMKTAPVTVTPNKNAPKHWY
jgi:hypothetical protein